MIGLIVFVVIIWLLIGLASIFILGICSDRGPAYTAEGRFIRKQKRELEQFGYILRAIFIAPLSLLIGFGGFVIIVFVVLGLLRLCCGPF